jgi:predicted glycosyltransferase involved in capsule biosynthesis
MKASVIFRFTNRSARRAENLKMILRYVSQKKIIETIVVVMEKDVDLKHIKTRKHFIKSAFESSKANNIGASIATSDILVFQDADIFFDLRYYDMIIGALGGNGYESVRVGEKCVNLGHMYTNANCAKMTQLASNHFKECLRDAPGACIALTRSAFVKVGGYCELFKVYGWEDCYMRYKVQKLTKQKNLGMQTLHLPHETNYQMGKQATNAPLYQRILGDLNFCVARDREDLFNKYPKFRSYK